MGKKFKGCTLARQDGWYKAHRESFNPGRVYEPFLRTDDVPSHGVKSKVPHFRDTTRLVHVLSLNELWMYLHLVNNPFVIDVYEQYAIPLDTSLAIADMLEVKHPVYADTRVPIVQTIDFMARMMNPETGEESLKAFPVKQPEDAQKLRTAEKLALQQGFCRLEDIEYDLITSDVLRTVHSQNLDTLYRHRELSVFLGRVAKRWLPNFFGALSDDRHARTAHLVERASTATGVNYDTGISIFYNALWHKQIRFNWSQYLRLEKAASDLGLGAHAA